MKPPVSFSAVIVEEVLVLSYRKANGSGVFSMRWIVRDGARPPWRAGGLTAGPHGGGGTRRFCACAAFACTRDGAPKRVGGGGGGFAPGVACFAWPVEDGVPNLVGGGGIGRLDMDVINFSSQPMIPKHPPVRLERQCRVQNPDCLRVTKPLTI
jgi:hypothetical protein